MLKLVEGHYRSLEAALPGEVEDALARGPAAVVTAGYEQLSRIAAVLGGSGRRVFAGLELLPGFPQLAGRLGSAPAAAEAVSSADRILMGIEAIRSIPAGRPFSHLEGMPGAARALSDFFERDLLDRGVTPEAYGLAVQAGVESPAAGSCGIAFETYSGLRRKLYGGTSDALAEGLGTGRPTRFSTMVFYGFFDLNPLQRRILSGLLKAGARCVFMTPVALADPRWSNMATSTRTFLERHVSDRSRPDAVTGQGRFAAFAEGLIDGRPSGIPDGFRMVEAGGPSGVGRAVADAAASALSRGTAPSGLAVAGGGPSSEAVRAFLESSGIAACQGRGPSVGSLPLADLLVGLCALGPDGIHYSSLISLLGCGAIDPAISPAPADLCEAIRTGGPRRGRAMLENLAQRRDLPFVSAAAAAVIAAEREIPPEAEAPLLFERLCRAASRLACPGTASRLLEALPSMAAIRSSSRVTRREMAGMLPPVLADIRLEAPGCERCASLLSLEGARGTLFDTVILYGLEEGTLPGRTFNDPRLPEDLRRSLELPSLTARETEQALLFVQAAGAASSELVFVRMTADENGREVSWSPFIAPLVSGGGLKERIRIDSVSTPEKVLAGGRACGGAFFAEALSAESSRMDFSRGFDEYDGMTGGAARPWRSFSPTSLEAWMRCPFAWMAERIWSIPERMPPSIAPSPDPRTAGSIMHEAAGLVLAGGLEPAEALLEAAGRARLASVLGAQVFETAFVERAAAELGRLIDFLRASGLPLSGAVVEEDLEAGLLPGGLKLKGRIDIRIPTEDGPAVFDFKTGSTIPSRQSLLGEMERGAHLQLPLYAAMLASKGTAPASAGLLYAGRPTDQLTFSGADLGDLAEGAVAKAAEIAAMIGSGAFPPVCGSRVGADRCRFRLFCRMSPGARIDAKRSRTPGFAEGAAVGEDGDGC